MSDLPQVDVEGISISGTATVEVDFNNLDHSYVEFFATDANALVQLAKKSAIDVSDLIIAFSAEKLFDVLGEFSDEELISEVDDRHQRNPDPEKGFLNELNKIVYSNYGR